MSRVLLRLVMFSEPDQEGNKCPAIMAFSAIHNVESGAPPPSAGFGRLFAHHFLQLVFELSLELG